MTRAVLIEEAGKFALCVSTNLGNILVIDILEILELPDVAITPAQHQKLNYNAFRTVREDWTQQIKKLKTPTFSNRPVYEQLFLCKPCLQYLSPPPNTHTQCRRPEEIHRLSPSLIPRRARNRLFHLGWSH